MRAFFVERGAELSAAFLTGMGAGLASRSFIVGFISTALLLLACFLYGRSENKKKGLFRDRTQSLFKTNPDSPLKEDIDSLRTAELEREKDMSRKQTYVYIASGIAAIVGGILLCLRNREGLQGGSLSLFSVASPLFFILTRSQAYTSIRKVYDSWR